MATTTNINSHVDGAGAQFLTFTLLGDLYGVEILRVQEIRGWSGVRALPNLPAFIKGVVNLRGTLVPIVDLRSRFGLHASEYTATTVVIVVAIKTEQVSRLVGMVVDSVADVVVMPAARMRHTPQMGAKIDTRFIQSMAVLDDQMAVILNVDRLLGEDEIMELRNISDSGSVARTW